MSHTVGLFGNKRCVEKFDEFLIQTPKADSYTSVDQFISVAKSSSLFELCFKDLDSNFTIHPKQEFNFSLDGSTFFWH